MKSFDEERFTLKESRFNSEKHIGYKLNISDVILIDHISNIHNFSDEIYLFITETGEVTILSISLGTNSSCEGISYFMRKIDVENVIGLVDGNGIVEGNGDTLENYAYLIDINGKKYSVGKYLYN